MKKDFINIISDYPLYSNCDSTIESTQETNIYSSTSCNSAIIHNNFIILLPGNAISLIGKAPSLLNEKISLLRKTPSLLNEKVSLLGNKSSLLDEIPFLYRFRSDLLLSYHKLSHYFLTESHYLKYISLHLYWYWNSIIQYFNILSSSFVIRQNVRLNLLPHEWLGNDSDQFSSQAGNY